jgi:hypothetical protein
MNKKPRRDKHTDFEKYGFKPDQLWALLESCWEPEPENRPTIDEVAMKLKAMVSYFGTVSNSLLIK